jgi:hypothetical protein
MRFPKKLPKDSADVFIEVFFTRNRDRLARQKRVVGFVIMRGAKSKVLFLQHSNL